MQANRQRTQRDDSMKSLQYEINVPPGEVLQLSQSLIDPLLYHHRARGPDRYDIYL